MKMDKETLQKNGFWIGLGAFGPLWLIIPIVALVSAGDKVAEGKKKVEEAEGKVKGINEVKNSNFTSLLEKKKQDLEKEKDKVWAQAWKGQKDLMTWPDISSREQLEAGRFGEEIAPGERLDFVRDKKYNAQLPVEEIQKRLDPIQARGGWESLIKRATFKGEKDPSNEEVWLAQEDLWVQNELLNVIKAALDSAAKFQNVARFKLVEIPKAELDQAAAAPQPAAPAAPPATPALPAGTGAEEPAKPALLRQRFRNPHWQLDIFMEQNDKKELTATTQTKLTNIDANREEVPVAGLDLLVGQRAARPPQARQFHFEGAKPLKRGESLALKKAVPLPGFFANFEVVPFEVALVADKDDPPVKGALQRQRFRNPNWELELIFEQDAKGKLVISDKSKVKNINAAKHTLPLSTAVFRVQQGEKGHQDLSFPDDYLAWGVEPKTLKAPVAVNFDLSQPIEVEQVFSWATSPIKYVNAIELYYNSHRTANLALQPAKQFPAPEAPKEGSAPAGGPGMPGMPGGMSGQPVPPSGPSGPSGDGRGPMPPGMGGPGGDGSLTPNGLVRNRYIAVTDQVRHMPVALSLIVDQAHMQDVLTAVNNSRLRIQITQVQWQHAHGIKSGALALAPGGGGIEQPGPFPPGMGPKPPKFPGGGMVPPGGGMVPPGGGIVPPGGILPGGAPSAGAGDEDDPNLVELAVYGIAALYERYQPCKLTEKSLTSLRAQQVPEDVVTKLDPLKDKKFSTRDAFVTELGKVLNKDVLERHQSLILRHAIDSDQ